MGWNGQGELVCPLRGQSLESRLAAQPSVRPTERRGGAAPLESGEGCSGASRPRVPNSRCPDPPSARGRCGEQLSPHRALRHTNRRPGPRYPDETSSGPLWHPRHSHDRRGRQSESAERCHPRRPSQRWVVPCPCRGNRSVQPSARQSGGRRRRGLGASSCRRDSSCATIWGAAIMIAYTCPMSTHVRRGRPNKALHLTKRVGVPASRAVVEARFAGEGRCWADLR